jgi:hypothetical protein
VTSTTDVLLAAMSTGSLGDALEGRGLTGPGRPGHEGVGGRAAYREGHRPAPLVGAEHHLVSPSPPGRPDRQGFDGID